MGTLSGGGVAYTDNDDDTLVVETSYGRTQLIFRTPNGASVYMDKEDVAAFCEAIQRMAVALSDY
jgi:hypothetical protein